MTNSERLEERLQCLWFLCESRLPPCLIPPVEFDTNAIDLLMRRRGRTPNDLRGYLGLMGKVIRVVAANTEDGARTIALIGQGPDYSGPRLEFQIDDDTAGLIHGCNVTVSPAYIEEPGSPRRVYQIANVPLAVFAADREGNLEQEFAEQLGVEEVKRLAQAAGAVLLEAATRLET